MPNGKVRIKSVKLTKNDLMKGNRDLERFLVGLGYDLLGGATGYGVSLVPRQVNSNYGRKDRPIVNLTAKGDLGWKELYHGGVLTKIANMRKRFTGALRKK